MKEKKKEGVYMYWDLKINENLLHWLELRKYDLLDPYFNWREQFLSRSGHISQLG